MNWLNQIFRRHSFYNDLSEEMREHLEEKTEQLSAKASAGKKPPKPRGAPSAIQLSSNSAAVRSGNGDPLSLFSPT